MRERVGGCVTRAEAIYLAVDAAVATPLVGEGLDDVAAVLRDTDTDADALLANRAAAFPAARVAVQQDLLDRATLE